MEKTTEKRTLSGSFSQKTNSRREMEVDASFSSYLAPDRNHDEPTIIVNGSSSYPHQESRFRPTDDSRVEISIFDAKKYFNEVMVNTDAQKPMIHNNNNINRISPLITLSNEDQLGPRFSSASSSIDGYRNYRARSFHAATPTASSEASWNSQTGLLSNPPRVTISLFRDREQKNKTGRSSSLSSSSLSRTKWLFRRRSKCPCSGKKSVEVDESKLSSKQSEPKKTPPPNLLIQPPLISSIKKPVVKPSNSMISAENRILNSYTTESISMPSKAPCNEFLRPTSTTKLFKDENGVKTTIASTSTTGFTFPILNNTNSNNVSSLEDQPRDSLEVFRPPSEETTVDHRINHNNNIPNDKDCHVVSFTFRGSPKSRITSTSTDADDVASDASSDLFEIDCFSTQTNTKINYPITSLYHRRDSLDETRKLTLGGARRSIDDSIPMTSLTDHQWLYEPSEASIDWSVTTAEGFDKASVVTTVAEDDKMEIRKVESSEKMSGDRSQRMRSGGFLSCRSEKAVSVGAKAVKFVGVAAESQHVETERHVSSRAGDGNKPPTGRSPSATMSLAFVT